MDDSLRRSPDGRKDLVHEYRRILTKASGFRLWPLDRRVAEEGAILRARYGYRTPDAIQVATASVCGAEAFLNFLTNDRKLKTCQEVNVVLLDDFIENGSNPTPV